MKKWIKSSTDASSNKLILTVESGINADGFSAEVLSADGDIIFSENYRYGFNASHNRSHAAAAHKNVEDAKKYNWNNTYREKPFVSDIIDDLCRIYNISKANVEVQAGGNRFTGSKMPNQAVDEFISNYISSATILCDDDINLDEYEWVSNVDGYQVYRKIVTNPDGSTRGVWVAQDQDRIHPPFSITYRQARGFDPITEYEDNARRIGREIGQMLFGSTRITAAASYDYDRSMTYSRGGQKYRVYLAHEDDPDSLQFAVSEIHPYDDADYAWAMKNTPTSAAIIRNQKIEYSIPLPEWDWDRYEDIDEYVTECVDITCVALKEANSGVNPNMVHM